MGYRGEIGYQTFLYSNEADIRKLFMFLVENLPKESSESASEPAMGKFNILSTNHRGVFLRHQTFWWSMSTWFVLWKVGWGWESVDLVHHIKQGGILGNSGRGNLPNKTCLQMLREQKDLWTKFWKIYMIKTTVKKAIKQHSTKGLRCSARMILFLLVIKKLFPFKEMILSRKWNKHS